MGVISDSSASQTRRAVAYNNRGFAHTKNGDYDKAIADCSQAIRLDPDFAIAYRNRGFAHLQKGDTDKAIADYTAAIRLDPDYAVNYNNRGFAHTKNGDYDKAIADLTEAIRLDPDFADAYFWRSWAHRESGQFERAIEDANEAIRLDPDAFAYGARADAYREQGDLDSSLADWTEAIRLKPDDSLVYLNRGYVYDIKGDYDKAIADYTEAIRLDPDQAWAYQNRGVSYREAGEYKNALADFYRVIQMEQDEVPDLIPYVSLGLTYEKMGRLETARSEFETALKMPAETEYAKRAQKIAKEQLAALEAPVETVQSPAAGEPAAAPRGKRIALVIGNARYDNWSRLNNPAGDAEKLAALLERHGFEVTRQTDLDFLAFHDAIADFGAAARDADVALVYYAGHGMELAGRNILAPSDMPDACAGETLKRAIKLNDVFTAIQPANRRIVMLDACRNDPFPKCPDRSRAVSGGFRGLQRVVGTGTLVVNSTVSGALAKDGIAGQGSPFAQALLRRLETAPQEPFREVLALVAGDVAEATGGAQVPEVTLRGAPPRTCLAGSGCRR
jgi:tetratricopeptide (TPR) repeat protein